MELLEKAKSMTDEQSKLVEELVNEEVEKFCKELNIYVNFIKELLESNQAISDLELEDFALNLSTYMFFLGDNQELMGIRQDIAEARRKEKYDLLFSKALVTVADKTSEARLGTQYEQIVDTIYKRVYKTIQIKLDNANKLLDSVKKVLTRRIKEIELSAKKGDSDGRFR